MFRLLKINLIIIIIVSFPVLGNIDSQNKKENLNTWKQTTISYIKSLIILQGHLRKLIMLEIFQKEIFG